MKKVLLIAVVLTIGTLWPCAGVAVGQDTSGMSAAEMEGRGDILRAQHDFQDAIGYYKAALKLEPRNSMLYNKLGIVELRNGHEQLAESYFQKAVKYNDKNAHALNNIGVVAFSRKSYGKAIKYYKKALAIEESNATFHSNLGTAWFSEKKYDRAMAEYARAIELDPEVFLRSSPAGSIARVATTEDRARYEFMLAKLYAQRGMLENCFQWLAKAKEDGYNMKGIYKDSAFAKARQDPRLAQIVPPPEGAGY